MGGNEEKGVIPKSIVALGFGENAPLPGGLGGLNFAVRGG